MAARLLRRVRRIRLWSRHAGARMRLSRAFACWARTRALCACACAQLLPQPVAKAPAACPHTPSWLPRPTLLCPPPTLVLRCPPPPLPSTPTAQRRPVGSALGPVQAHAREQLLAQPQGAPSPSPHPGPWPGPQVRQSRHSIQLPSTPGPPGRQSTEPTGRRSVCFNHAGNAVQVRGVEAGMGREGEPRGASGQGNTRLTWERCGSLEYRACVWGLMHVGAAGADVWGGGRHNVAPQHSGPGPMRAAPTLSLPAGTEEG